MSLGALTFSRYDVPRKSCHLPIRQAAEVYYSIESKQTEDKKIIYSAKLKTKMVANCAHTS